MAQYDYASPIGKPGQIVNCELRNIKTFAAEQGIANVMYFGIAVHTGTGPGTTGWVYVSGSGDNVTGITVYSDLHFEGFYPQASAVSVLDKGVIYVKAGVNVTANEFAYIDSAGGFTNSAGTTNKFMGTFLTSASMNQPVQLRFDFSTISVPA